MMIGNMCCCGTQTFSRKTAALRVPYPGYAPFELPPEEYLPRHAGGWQIKKYLTFTKATIDLNGRERREIQRYNKFTGAAENIVETDSGFSAPIGSLGDPVLDGPALWHQNISSFFDDSYQGRIEYRLENEYLYQDAIAYWRPKFHDLFPDAAMRVDSQFTARPGLQNAGNPLTTTERPFEFPENQNRVILVQPYGSPRFDFSSPVGYNGGTWDETYEYVEYQILPVWRNSKSYALGGDPLPGFPDTEPGVYWDATTLTWRGRQNGLFFSKSCLQLPQGINCNAEHLNSAEDYYLQGLVQGQCDTVTGLVERAAITNPLPPGTYLFCNGINAPNQPSPEADLVFYALREPQSGLPWVDDVRWCAVPDHCPP